MRCKPSGLIVSSLLHHQSIRGLLACGWFEKDENEVITGNPGVNE